MWFLYRVWFTISYCVVCFLNTSLSGLRLFTRYSGEHALFLLILVLYDNASNPEKSRFVFLLPLSYHPACNIALLWTIQSHYVKFFLVKAHIPPVPSNEDVYLWSPLCNLDVIASQSVSWLKLLWWLFRMFDKLQFQYNFYLVLLLV